MTRLERGRATVDQVWHRAPYLVSDRVVGGRVTGLASVGDRSARCGRSPTAARPRDRCFEGPRLIYVRRMPADGQRMAR